jgi:transcription initiation factor IIE alpha subunit
MERFVFKPKYHFINVYFGVFTSIFAGFIFLILSAVYINLLLFLFSLVFIYSFVSALDTYPREILLESQNIVLVRFLLRPVNYSFYEIKRISLLKGRIELENGRIYYESMLNYETFLEEILERMKKLRVRIQFDEGLEIENIQ